MVAAIELLVAVNFFDQEVITPALILPSTNISIRVKILKFIAIVCNHIFKEALDTIIDLPKIFIAASKFDGVSIYSKKFVLIEDFAIV